DRRPRPQRRFARGNPLLRVARRSDPHVAGGDAGQSQPDRRGRDLLRLSDDRAAAGFAGPRLRPRRRSRDGGAQHAGADVDHARGRGAADRGAADAGRPDRGIEEGLRPARRARHRAVRRDQGDGRDRHRDEHRLRRGGDARVREDHAADAGDDLRRDPGRDRRDPRRLRDERDRAAAAEQRAVRPHGRDGRALAVRRRADERGDRRRVPIRPGSGQGAVEVAVGGIDLRDAADRRGDAGLRLLRVELRQLQRDLRLARRGDRAADLAQPVRLHPAVRGGAQRRARASDASRHHGRTGKAHWRAWGGDGGHGGRDAV
ncbi:MAG: Ribonuclease BN, partial [uncultured Sphingomonadaceae bacterium]